MGKVPAKSEKDSEKKATKAKKSATANRIAMFEAKEKSASAKKTTSPPPKKLKKKALNAKFAHMNINPRALKPGAAGKTKILGREKDGSLDATAKVEQTTITKGKRKRRKKKRVVVEEVMAKEEKVVAPQLFYDEKAAAKTKAKKEKERKQNANGSAGKVKGKGKGKGAAAAGSDGDDTPPPAPGGGGCCIVQ